MNLKSVLSLFLG